MYVTHYLRKDIATQEVTRFPFSRNDANAAQVPYASLAGIPQLEALVLINQKNVEQENQRFVYAVE